MKALITFLSLLIIVVLLVALPSAAAPYTELYGPVNVFYCAKAIMLCVVFAAVACLFIRRTGEFSSFLLRVFILALMLRVLIGAAIFAFNAQDFFGGDA